MNDSPSAPIVFAKNEAVCEFTSEFIGFVEIFLQSDTAKSKEICSDVSVGSAMLPKITPICSGLISEVLHFSNADFPAIAVILNTGSRLSSSIPYLEHNFCIVSSDINAPISVYALLGVFVSDITDDESKIHLFLGACLNADLPFSIISQKSLRSSHSGKIPPIPTIAMS